MSRFTDLDMEFVRNPITGDVSVKTDAQAVIRSIKNILLTSSGEKKFNPDFGGSIRSLLFDQVDPITTVKITDSIRRSINLYENRAVILDLLAYPDEANSRYGVKLTFRLKNDPRPITTSFKLERLR